MQRNEIPREVPVMTMNGTVLFPHAMMRYTSLKIATAVLRAVLESDRVLRLRLWTLALKQTHKKRPHMVAGIGVIRACKTNSDGTSNLILRLNTRFL